jgi:hypothetical protein
LNVIVIVKNASVSEAFSFGVKFFE